MNALAKQIAACLREGDGWQKTTAQADNVNVYSTMVERVRKLIVGETVDTHMMAVAKVKETTVQDSCGMMNSAEEAVAYYREWR